ncbi:hypothetical protein V6N13_132575 [Hibiscus sabdariffa]
MLHQLMVISHKKQIKFIRGRDVNLDTRRSTVGFFGRIWMSPYDIALLYNSLDPGAFDPADTNSPPYFVNEDLIYEDDLPPTSPDALNNTQDYDLGPEDLPLLDNFVELTSDAATGDGVEEEGSTDLDLSLHF